MAAKKKQSKLRPARLDNLVNPAQMAIVELEYMTPRELEIAGPQIRRWLEEHGYG